MPNLFDMIADDEAAALAQTRLDIAREKAEWDALTPEQQAAHTAAVEAKYADVPDIDDEPCDTCGLPANDPDCECGYDATDYDGEGE